MFSFFTEKTQPLSQGLTIWSNYMDTLFQGLQGNPEIPLKSKIEDIALQIQSASSITRSQIEKLKTVINDDLTANPPFTKERVAKGGILTVIRELVSYSVLLDDDTFLIDWCVEKPKQRNFVEFVADGETRDEKLNTLLTALKDIVSNPSTSKLPESGHKKYALLLEKLTEACRK